MKLQPGWTAFWIAYVLVGVVAEATAIVQKQPGDTLSEQVWAARESLGPEVFSLLLFLAAGLAAWAVYHFAVQGDA